MEGEGGSKIKRKTLFIFLENIKRLVFFILSLPSKSGAYCHLTTVCREGKTTGIHRLHQGVGEISKSNSLLVLKTLHEL